MSSGDILCVPACRTCCCEKAGTASANTTENDKMADRNFFTFVLQFVLLRTSFSLLHASHNLPSKPDANQLAETHRMLFNQTSQKIFRSQAYVTIGKAHDPLKRYY